jgi:uncharacterized protein YggE
MLRQFITQVVTFTAFFAATPVWADDTANMPQITIVGTGVISVVPDIARINIGVRESADSAADAMAAMRSAMNRVFEQIGTAGIDTADMQTGTIRLQQRYENSGLSSGVVKAGFEASTSVTITVRDISALGGVIDVVVEDGVNNIDGLQFDVADRSPHVLAARQASVADARSAAEVYAQAAGIALGSIMSIREVGGHSAPFAAMEMAQSRGGSTPVAVGELDIARSVEIIYQLEP